MPTARKHVTSARRGKACGRREARESMWPTRSAGIRVAGAKPGKIRSWCQARENMWPVSRAVKASNSVSRAKRGKTHASLATIGFGSAPYLS